jgi:predicted O-methyltransferase YrrM
MAPSFEWGEDDEFELDGVKYRSNAKGSTPEHLTLLKPRFVVEQYVALVERLQPRTILDLGIYAGGSAALLAQLAQPDRLVALDIRKGCAPLDRHIAEHHLEDVIHPRYGVDQSDTDQLDEIMATEFGNEPIDLVIDDASHLADLTRASFNRLFPHVRPGGLYVIEDWSWAHNRMPAKSKGWQGVEPLSAFMCELLIGSACRRHAIAEVTFDYYWAVVRRGPADLDPTDFDLAAKFDPVGRDMAERVRLARSLAES